MKIRKLFVCTFAVIALLSVPIFLFSAEETGTGGKAEAKTRVGVVSAQGEGFCLAINIPNLQPGDLLIALDLPLVGEKASTRQWEVKVGKMLEIRTGIIINLMHQ